MSCDRIASLLDDFVDGLLGAEDDAAVAAHVAGCASCADVLDRLTEAVDALALLPRVDVPDGLADRIVARVPLASARPVAAAGAAPPRARELRRVAGWLVVGFGLAWQLGAGAVAARAMEHAAPVLARACERVERSRLRGRAFLDATSGASRARHRTP